MEELTRGAVALGPMIELDVAEAHAAARPDAHESRHHLTGPAAQTPLHRRGHVAQQRHQTARVAAFAAVDVRRARQAPVGVESHLDRIGVKHLVEPFEPPVAARLPAGIVASFDPPAIDAPAESAQQRLDLGRSAGRRARWQRRRLDRLIDPLRRLPVERPGVGLTPPPRPLAGARRDRQRDRRGRALDHLLDQRPHQRLHRLREATPDHVAHRAQVDRLDACGAPQQCVGSHQARSGAAEGAIGDQRHSFLPRPPRPARGSRQPFDEDHQRLAHGRVDGQARGARLERPALPGRDAADRSTPRPAGQQLASRAPVPLPQEAAHADLNREAVELGRLQRVRVRLECGRQAGGHGGLERQRAAQRSALRENA